MAAQALARTEGVPAQVGEAATDPEVFAAQKLLSVAGKEGYPEALEVAAQSCLLKLAERPSRAKADFLHALLAERSIGSAGANPVCRTAAAQALVGMGFPYALEISPDDLALLKRTRRWGKKIRRALAVLTALGGAGLTVVVASVAVGGRFDSAGGLAPLAVAAGVLGGVIGEAVCPPGTDAARLSRGVAWLSVVGSLIAAYLLNPVCGVPFVTGLLAQWLTPSGREKP